MSSKSALLTAVTRGWNSNEARLVVFPKTFGIVDISPVLQRATHGACISSSNRNPRSASLRLDGGVALLHPRSCRVIPKILDNGTLRDCRLNIRSQWRCIGGGGASLANGDRHSVRGHGPAHYACCSRV